MIGKNKGKIYYNNPETGKVINLLPNQIPPEGFIKGNPNANTGYANKGKKCYYHSITFKEIRIFGEPPEGYLPGKSPKNVMSSEKYKLSIEKMQKTMKENPEIGKKRSEKIRLATLKYYENEENKKKRAPISRNNFLIAADMNRGTHWYNDGIKNYRLKPDNPETKKYKKGKIKIK